MPLFSRKPTICPICSAEIAGGDHEIAGHMGDHFEDAVLGDPSSGLRLACGCPDAVWDVNSNFPYEAVEHLRRKHGMR